MTSINIDIYKNVNDQQVYLKSYNYPLHKTLLELKKEILQDFFNNQYNYIQLMNITPKIYKDYGLMFFDKGLIPTINDNYTFDKFTLPDRTFQFLVEPTDLASHTKIRKREVSNIGMKKGVYKHPRNEMENNQYAPRPPQVYEFNEDDFPPLGGK
jgi:hypothetical protein